MIKRWMILVMAVLLCVGSAVACKKSEDADEASKTEQAAVTPVEGTVEKAEEGETPSLTFDGASYSFRGDADAIAAEHATVTIKKAGTYEIYGKMNDGQLAVEVSKSEEVTLILCGVDMTSSFSAPLYIKSADRVTVVLKEGTKNRLTDAATYVYPSSEIDKPNACLYSDEDMTIEGDGFLEVEGRYNNGIGCKNDLTLRSGSVTVSAPNNGVKGNDSIRVEGGTLTVRSAQDALKTDATESNKGFIRISGGYLSLVCSDDALQATHKIEITGGGAQIEAGGKVYNCKSTNDAGQEVAGTVTVDSAVRAKWPAAA